jgi:hypothetical protein
VFSYDGNCLVLVVEVVDCSADDVVVVVDHAYGRLIAVIGTHAICEI